jgi:hypothetical protein
MIVTRDTHVCQQETVGAGGVLQGIASRTMLPCSGSYLWGKVVNRQCCSERNLYDTDMTKNVV